jgi:GDP-D-mannose dehydratase
MPNVEKTKRKSLVTGLHGGLGSEFSKMGMGFGYEMNGWTRLDLEKPTQRVLRLRKL